MASPSAPRPIDAIGAPMIIFAYQRIKPFPQGKPQRDPLSRPWDHGRNNHREQHMRTTGTPDLLRDEHAAAAIEYALIAALIALACIIAFQSLGLNLANIFNTINNALS